MLLLGVSMPRGECKLMRDKRDETERTIRNAAKGAKIEASDI